MSSPATLTPRRWPTTPSARWSTTWGTPEQPLRDATGVQQEQSSLNNEPTVGIGVYLTGGGSTPLRIESIIPGSPADKSKQLKPGDTITAVNGTSIQGKTLDQVRPMIAGKDGTTVTLSISRQNGDQTQTLDVTLTRGSFTAPVVTSYLIPGLNIADIQIAQFADSTDTELRKALQDANDKKVAGIILDLRGNPGGYLDQAIKVASEFIPAGPNKNVLIEKTRTSSTTDAVQPGGLATKTPLTILVDGDTASAAEIVTGAIAVNRSEVHIVGQTTFGTGTVLNTFHLADGSALILGTEEFLLPNGKAIYHHGCLPDQAISLPQGATPITALAAQEQNITADQIQQSQDTQLQRAIQNFHRCQRRRPHLPVRRPPHRQVADLSPTPPFPRGKGGVAVFAGNLGE